MLTNDIHLLNRTVTGLALDISNRYVLRVIKVSEVRKVVNADPLNGFILVVCAYDLAYFVFTCEGTGLDLVVTVHADIDRRNSSVLAFCDTCVTVLAINFVLTRVDL